MDKQDEKARKGLAFFGRISASVTHEIKNVFAVINEAAGLIEDFTLMAERGMPIQPDKLKNVANAIQGQIRRGDGIVKNMNAFSHSTDEPIREVNLVETLELIVALTTRLADMQQIRLSLGSSEPIVVVASPFDLMQLLHGAMASVMEELSPGDSLLVGVKPVEGGASFSLSSPGKDVSPKNDEGVAQFAKAIGASISDDATTGTCEIFVPTTRSSE